MFRSEPMQKLRIVCLEKDKRSVVSALHKAGILDLRKSRLELADDSAAEHFTQLSDAQIRIAGAVALLNRPKRIPKRPSHREAHMNAEELISKASKLGTVERIYGLVEEKKQLQQLSRQLEHAESIARQISGINVNFDNLKSNVLQFGAYVALGKKDMAALKDDIAKSGLAIEMIGSRENGQYSMLLAYRKGIDMEQLARKHKLKELDMSNEHIHGTPAESLGSIAKGRADCLKRIESIGSELDAIGRDGYMKLSALMEMLDIEMTKARVSETFKRTDKATIIEGWIPGRRARELHETVSKATSGKYYIEEMHTDELAPTLMNRPKILQPFDYMINFISVPRSDELDPAIPFIISFPIFYGLMVTDVGYGIVSLLFSIYITRITDPDGLVYNTAKIWQLSSISAIAFGFLSNQYFGLQLNHYFTTFAGFDWFKSVTTIILISVLFGLMHVIIGLIFGFINKYKHHRKIAFGRLASVFLMVSGTLAIAGGLFRVFGSTVTLASAGIAILSLIATIALSGEEAGEITNLISHPLSYARIMGFGLASVVLAFLIDKAFTPNLSMGIPMFVLYLILFIVLHFMNMIVSMFEGAVQGARLNFIEFFSKFYTGGGIRFNPFSSKRIYTKE